MQTTAKPAAACSWDMLQGDQTVGLHFLDSNEEIQPLFIPHKGCFVPQIFCMKGNGSSSFGAQVFLGSCVNTSQYKFKVPYILPV